MGNLEQDACMIMWAKHLAISDSSFALGLSWFNTVLTSMHVPFGKDTLTNYGKIDRYWNVYAHTETSALTLQYLYTFPGFSPPWQNRSEMSKNMVSYPKAAIVQRA